ncbi:uncharacterized protein BO66DRAFT_37216 [Aspergillus aculeatinus CBS 121060]|uniref:Uncharacterized protein n=1 Tax=Aspergillus aculeatinus CBS 121060 TaxID=1448322 RepID=A0ACD1HEU5_9EURO|nr:hypothetical protein BO66DRAFT_37216 [Aspergillus aculeatinus CBS 121060]RAH72073.1 hypothetical protein BO66DRAFT_37216 [Aspergillus aculeatinus CBS 121060]
MSLSVAGFFFSSFPPSHPLSSLLSFAGLCLPICSRRFWTLKEQGKVGPVNRTIVHSAQALQAHDSSTFRLPYSFASHPSTAIVASSLEADQSDW